MKKNDMPSLLPYLEPSGARFCLKISLLSEDASDEEAPSSPFLTVSGSGLTRLIKARFVTDAGSSIRDVFLLMQRDECRLRNNELHPLTNQDIRQCWQRTFGHSGGQQHSHIRLADQIGKNGLLLPFQPLFYCKTTRRFFHPPCPNCGFPLQECDDDRLLSDSGLRPYSTSLRRYLFCPTCMDSDGKSDFYVFLTEDHDPQILKDCSNLIRGFSKQRIISRACRFPCPECDDFQHCHGPNGLADSRIIPFSFYSFFMLIFESESVVSASDFFSLISGDSFEETEGISQQLVKSHFSGEDVSSFFHNDKDERHFPEILYLKISFLAELVQNILPNLDNYTYPDLALSLDQIWIRISEPTPFFSFLPNLRLEFVDMGESPLKTPFFPKSPPSYGRYFLWTVWFFTLLVNQKQTVTQIHSAMEQSVGKIFSGTDDYDDDLKGVFSPENIFRNPKGKSVGEAHRELWKDTLRLGWVLLRTDSDKDEFCLRLETLREDIRQQLFRETSVTAPPVTPKEQDTDNRDKAIHNILLNIMDKWRTEFEEKIEQEEEAIAPREPETADEHPIDWDMPTRVLRPHDIEKILESVRNETEEDDDIPKTRIIPSGK
ncbi:MAG: hypothetical protein B6245_17055 [Desulfobacteraceae bacterium 4572_88]|nr:MAG: hypothetical protein B6245_17055 [Desulfobacteraceae bacterium 4572_88]